MPSTHHRIVLGMMDKPPAPVVPQQGQAPEMLSVQAVAPDMSQALPLTAAPGLFARVLTSIKNVVTRKKVDIS